MNEHDETNETDKTGETAREPWESEMTSEFDRRVRDLHVAPLTLDHVKGQAVTIRRKRRAAVAGGVLAAAAVIVPAAVVAADSTGGRDTEVPLATSTPSTAPPVATGPSYVEGTSYHRADGSVYELPAATYRQAVTLGERVVAYRWDEQALTGVVDVVADGAVVDTYLAPMDFVADEDSEVVAFMTSSGKVQTLWDGGERVLADGYSGWSVRAVSGGPDCLDPEAGGAGCRVFLKDDGPEGGTIAVDSSGLEEPPVTDAEVIYDADRAGRLTVVNEIRDDGSCGGVYDEAAGAYRFEQCDYTLTDFSPDGSLVLAPPAYRDGPGDGFVAVLDAATGEEVARLEPADGFIGTFTWLDDRTFAAEVFDYGDQAWTIQTLTVGDGDGTPVTAVGPVPGEDVASPIHVVG
jgi:hypothetical protein